MKFNNTKLTTMNMLCAGVISCIMLAGTAVYSRGAPEDSTKEAADQNSGPEEKIAANYLTGDWGGVRQAMADKGVVFETVYTNESVANVAGGLTQGYAVLGNLDVTLDADLEKLAGWGGGEIFVYGLGGFGQSPTELVGDLQTSSNIEAGMNYFKLYEVWFQQNLLDDKISILLGLHDLNGEFYVTDPAGLFFNSSFGIGADMSQSGENGPSIFPSTALAARLKIEPVEHFYASAAAYNAVAGDPLKPWATAADFTFANGFLIIGEIGFAVENNMKIAAGGWGYTKPVVTFTDTPATGYGAYLLFDKTIGEHVSFFIRGGMANPATYQVAFNVAEGIHLSGALWGRDDDELGIGATTVINSTTFTDLMSTAGAPVDTQETAIELTYRIAATPWASLQPDLQYVVNPGTNPGTADAVVVSLRAELSF